jgi:hypothetical protein
VLAYKMDRLVGCNRHPLRAPSILLSMSTLEFDTHYHLKYGNNTGVGVYATGSTIPGTHVILRPLEPHPAIENQKVRTD